MTLDEAIKHCKEVAKNLYAEGEDECTECANEHEQLAEWLEDYKRLLGEKSYAMGYQDGLEDGLNDIRPKGKWEKYGDTVQAYDIAGVKAWGQKRRCTNCGFLKIYIEDFGFYSFCPNCGADMRGEE